MSGDYGVLYWSNKKKNKFLPVGGSFRDDLLTNPRRFGMTDEYLQDKLRSGHISRRSLMEPETTDMVVAYVVSQYGWGMVKVKDRACIIYAKDLQNVHFALTQAVQRHRNLAGLTYYMTGGGGWPAQPLQGERFLKFLRTGRVSNDVW